VTRPRDPADGVARVARAALPFGNGEAELLDDLADLHDMLAMAINLRSIEPGAHGLPVAQRSALRLVVDIGLAAIASTPTASLVDDGHEGAIALLCAGRIDYRIAGRLWTAEAGRTALYLPGEMMRVRAHQHVGLAYNLNPQLLARHLIELCPSLSLEAALVALQRPWPIDLGDPERKPALQHLDLIVQLLDGAGPLEPTFPLLTVLQDRLYRVSAQLLLPALARG
jgi:hypothetical protein